MKTQKYILKNKKDKQHTYANMNINITYTMRQYVS